MADKKEKQCTVIVSYEVAHEDAERFLDSWEKANNFLRKQPGFVSTALHRAVSANPDFRFVNVSCWENDDAFRSATQSQEFREASGRLVPFPIHASAYEIVKT
ncbi:MAG TPA: antibiotic biosynthesis monooxygenase family protein [Acidimicrobiales bacterium]|nr:antibiotic biosynthesis monooxygenase family protein [Acidimicrobiales bacterium]